MPYSVPAVDRTPPAPLLPTSPTSPRLGGHRRSRSSGNFSDERGPGAFVSLGALPRSHKKAVFHIELNDNDDDDDMTSSSTPRPSLAHAGSSYLSHTNSLRLSMHSGKFSPSIEPPPRIQIPPSPASVPFPTSSSPDPDSPFVPSLISRTSSSPSASASLPRTPSTPIILSNGKPLKPSLKSSSSSPHISDILLRGASKHLRAQSAPSTPAGPKNVHFAEDGGLASVRVFSRSGKPASLSKPPGEETETETEAENTAGIQNAFPFPSLSTPNESPIHEIDPSPERTSPVPTSNPSQYANVFLETLALPRTLPPALRGTVLVRNIAFEKHVAVRFTLDDWQTTSEVTCRHVVSLPSLPPPFPQARTLGDLAGSIANGDLPKEDESKPNWDRFSFTIRLEDYEYKLTDRTMYLVARFSANADEWWDNNDGQNYRVGFRRAAASPSAQPHNYAGMGLGMGLGFGSNAQQRTFSAPSTLRATPMTVTMQQRGEQRDEIEKARRAVQAAAEAEVDRARSRLSAQAMARSFSVPMSATPSRMPPPAFGPGARAQEEGSSRPSSTPSSPAQAFIMKRLSLSNYVAPGSNASANMAGMSMVTPPMTPPSRSRSASLPGDAGMSADTPSASDLTTPAAEDGPACEENGSAPATQENADAPAPSPTTLEPSFTRKSSLEPLDFRLAWNGASQFGAEFGMGLGIEFPAPSPSTSTTTAAATSTTTGKSPAEQLLSPPDSPVARTNRLHARGHSHHHGHGARFSLPGSSSSSSSESSRSSSPSRSPEEPHVRSGATAEPSYSPPRSGSPRSSSPDGGDHAAADTDTHTHQTYNSNIPSAFRDHDSSYAALIRQWCFTGSPTGSPVGTPFGSASALSAMGSSGGPGGVASPPPSGGPAFGSGAGRGYGAGVVGAGAGAGYGFPGFGFGMSDAGMVGGE